MMPAATASSDRRPLRPGSVMRPADQAATAPRASYNGSAEDGGVVARARASTPLAGAPLSHREERPVSGMPDMSKPSAISTMRESNIRSSSSVAAAKALKRPTVLLPPKMEAGSGDAVLKEARALRQQAEELSLSRKGNVEALEQQMADLRQRSKEELVKMEKRNRQLAADNEGLRRDLDLKSTRAQHENDVARQWEAAWTSESDQRRQLVEKLKDRERHLEEERKMHALEKERRETFEQRLETAVLQALTQKQELEDARDKALAEHTRSLAKAKEAEDELAELRPRAARSDDDAKSSSRENEELRARNLELQHALNTAQQTIALLTQQLNDSEKRRESQVEEVIRQRDEVMEINAQLCGHRNAKQKIQYLLKVKDEKEELKKDKSRLESIVKNLAGSSSAASSLLHLFTPSKNDDSQHAGVPNDSTMLSLAPTEDTPVTPGPCILEASNVETPGIAASIISDVRSSAKAGSSAPGLRHSAKLTQPRSPRLQTRHRRQASSTNA